MTWITALEGPVPFEPYMMPYLILIMLSALVGVFGLVMADRGGRDWLIASHHWSRVPLLLLTLIGMFAWIGHLYTVAVVVLPLAMMADALGSTGAGVIGFVFYITMWWLVALAIINPGRYRVPTTSSS